MKFVTYQMLRVSFLMTTPNYIIFLEKRINAVAMTSDNKFIVSGSDDKSIKVFDIENQKEVHKIEDTHLSIFFFF